MEFKINKMNISLFDGSNWATWSWKVTNVFAVAGLLSLLNDAKAAPKEEEKTKVNLIFSQTMTEDQLLHVVHLDTPYKQWQALRSIHDQSSAERKQKLMAEFFNIQMSTDEEASSFLARVLDIKYRLKQLGQDISDEMVIASVLNKLPSKFALFVESWNMADRTACTFESFQGKLLQAEVRMKPNSMPSGINQALAAHGAFRGQGQSGTEFGRKDRSTIICYYCQEPGHVLRNCLKLKKKEDEDKSNDDSEGSSVNKSVAMTMGRQVFASRGSLPIWIGDSGASHHMCPVKEWFSELVLSPEHCVKTAIGHDTPVLGRGTVKVMSCGKELTIREVLYVPTLTNCLLSLSVADSRGFSMTIRNKMVKCFDRYRTLHAIGRVTSGNMYAMDFKPIAGLLQACKNKSRPAREQCYRRPANRNLRKTKGTLDLDVKLTRDVKLPRDVKFATDVKLPRYIKFPRDVKSATFGQFSSPVTEQYFDSEEMLLSALPPSDSEERKETLSRVESLEEGLTSSPRARHHAVVEAVQSESIPALKPSRLKDVRSGISGLLMKRKETWSHAESLEEGAGFNASIQAIQPGSISASKPARLNATSFNVSDLLEERKGSWSEGSHVRDNCPNRKTFRHYRVVNSVSSVRLSCPETINDVLDSSANNTLVYGSVTDKNDWRVVHRKYRRNFVRP